MPRPKDGKKTTESQPKEQGTITFSTRLTEDQRDRVVEAAGVRGWSPSNLIRVAALEKAAHILNTSRQTRFDFKGLAHKIATQLMKPYVHWGTDPEDPEEEPYAESLSQPELNELKHAARLGGAELLNLVIDACESMTAPDRKDLPEPIDPI